MPLPRRKFIKNAMIIPAIASEAAAFLSIKDFILHDPVPFKRVRPGDAAWPDEKKWDSLQYITGGNLVKLESPLNVCKTDDEACKALFKNLKNPYYIGDNPALTQTSGYHNAWRSEASVYAVAARNTGDVIAAVNFARENNLRLVVKGGGHSYQGTSNSVDSLLVWTRAMNQIEMHDSFIPEGCNGKIKAQPAVTLGSGCIWWHTYNAVATKAGRYVQGGGCGTVGVAGLIQSGGFGSFSKKFGLAAAALLEAEIVTADGEAKVVNACNHPDLFWALKGGGGGSFGVVTRLTLRTRELPQRFGVVFGRIKAKDDASFKELIRQLLTLYRDKLMKPDWGEQIGFHTDRSASFNMLFSGITKEDAKQTWKGFEDWLQKQSKNYMIERPLGFVDLPAGSLWDGPFLQKNAPGSVVSDDRPGNHPNNYYWQDNVSEAGQYLWGYHSAWMPASLLEKNKLDSLVNAIFNGSRTWSVNLHCNKGLAGATKEEIAAARDTAMNPVVLDAFALLIVAGEGDPAFKGVAGHEPNETDSAKGAARIEKAFNDVVKVVPNYGSYVSESNYFLKNWQQAFWGSNYKRLSEVKKKYDPDGLFYVHHGVGSEAWSENGFTKK